MGVNPVIAGDSFAADLQVAFLETYEPKYATNAAKIGGVMELDLSSDKDQEKYFYWLSTPHPRIWKRGENISSKPFDGVQFSVSNLDWARKIEWHANDRDDDQTNSLEAHARNLGSNFALLNERIFFQILLGSTDSELLPSVPSAPDGAAFFATTAGGSARFGATDGNLLTGSGVASGDIVRGDFWTAVAQFRLFQDTEGQPLWDDGTLDGRYIIIYGAGNEEVFREAFLQGRTAIGANTATSNAAVTNTILESGVQVSLWSTQRITDNDWFVFLADSPTKSVFRQVREALTENVQTMENSDIARSTKIEGVQWHTRAGYGLSLPIQSIKVNNV